MFLKGTMSITMSGIRKVLPFYTGKCLYSATNKGGQRSGNYLFQTHDRSPISKRYLATAVGDKASITKVFTKDDVQKFADITYDHNPIHLDEEYAKTTRFGNPVVHGVLTLGLLSGVMGTVLPGNGSILVSYSIEYPAPLYIGEKVTAQVEAVKIDGRRATFKLSCFTDEKVVITGESCLLLPKVIIPTF